jgi:hypothetical protein
MSPTYLNSNEEFAMTIISKEIAQAATTLRNEVRTQVWAALVGEKRPLSQLKLHVTVGKDVFRFKDVADLIERANAVHKANARTLSGTGVSVFDEVLAAKVVLQRGSKTEDVGLSLQRGKLVEVVVEGEVPTKVAKKAPKAADVKPEPTVRKPRTTAAQRAAEIDAEHKTIAEVAGGKKARQPRTPKADAAPTDGKKARQPRKPAADKK